MYAFLSSYQIMMILQVSIQIAFSRLLVTMELAPPAFLEFLSSQFLHLYIFLLYQLNVHSLLNLPYLIILPLLFLTLSFREKEVNNNKHIISIRGSFLCYCHMITNSFFT